ncbi:MAG: homocysteine S-methyltransferase [Gemmatimonadota bacterium]|nr:homocysteine S-methyltransferase [Gemmatimonadota bacterium]MDE2871823.1 homocysteine S-methyltransferase [Gemmatimonadota bacterium]
MSGAAAGAALAGHAASQGFVVLDGGLATELERAGHKLNDPLWSAKVLLSDPGAVEAVHTAYLDAGADCVTTATYQATFQGLAARGIAGRRAEALLRGAVELALRARERFCARTAGRRNRLVPLVAASVGPYGAYLADGSEYRGDYSIGREALADFHRRRWHVLARSRADILACETLPSLAEARVLARLARETPETPAWFSFTCRDAGHLSDGTPIGEVAAWADQEPGVSTVGVNCIDASLVPELVGALAHGTAKPVIAYPNAGGVYDPRTRRWARAEPAPDWGEACRGWIAAGAVGVGGCCRVGPEAIRRMRAALVASRAGG